MVVIHSNTEQTMEIREYRKSDLRAILGLFVDTVRKVNVRDYTHSQIEAWVSGALNVDAWDKSLSEHYSLVACDSGLIIGFGDIDKTGYLDRLYVHPDYQGQGVASVLCDRLESFVGVSVITVHASITARPFFEKRGYEVVREQTVIRQGVPLINFLMKRSPVVTSGVNHG